MAREHAVLVGAGGISAAWFRPAKLEKVEIVGVVDLNLDAARKRIERFELDCPAGTDLKAMLKAQRPDFVIDCTVPEAHCSVTCTAMRAGCHVVGEKPMASSLAEGQRMVRTSDQTGKLYMVGQSRRWDPKHDVIRKVVTAGKIGQVTSINCDFFLGAHFGGFRAEMESPLVLDMSIHHFDLARYLTGADPAAVYCHEYNPVGSWYKGDVSASCIFEMTNGSVFTYRGSWCSEGPPTSWDGDWRIIGEKGTVLYDHNNPPTAHVPARGRKSLMSDFRELKMPKETLKYRGQRGALREMLAFLRTGKKPQTESHDNIKSLAMVFGAMESARKRRRIEIK